jgi:sugar lactone lactonase YvrE
MEDRRLLRMEYGHLVVHAELYEVAEHHCNDMVVDAVGRAYVGNFGFDHVEARRAGTLREAIAAHTGGTLVRVDPDGSVHRVAKGLMFANGMVITLDGRTLIVAETLGSRLTAFRIDADGTLADRRVWADLGDRQPDGICLDQTGAVWVADCTRNECVRVAEGGEELQVVHTPLHCYACTLGGRDGRTLFMMTAPAYDPDRNHRHATGAIVAVDVEHGRPRTP